MFEWKHSSGRVVAKLAWIKVLVGEIRIGPGVGQRFGSPRVNAHSWQKGILVTAVFAGIELFARLRRLNVITSKCLLCSFPYHTTLSLTTPYGCVVEGGWAQGAQTNAFQP